MKVIQVIAQREYKNPVTGGRNEVSKAMEERINRERIDCSYEHIKNLMEAMKLTTEQAMAILKISDTDKAVLSKRF